jgi:poly(A) polymerase
MLAPPIQLIPANSTPVPSFVTDTQRLPFEGSRCSFMKEKLLFDLIHKTATALGMRIFLVGGAVRDRLLGRLSSQDYDFVLESGSAKELAEELAKQLAAQLVYFPQFHTAQLSRDDLKIELVDARTDRYSENTRKPQVERAALLDDLRRRDFTVNTLLQDLSNGQVLDLLCVRSDLRQRILRTPLDPSITFQDDPLRMLRAIRFAVRLGFAIDEATGIAIRQKASLLPAKVSAERIKSELDQMMVTPQPERGIQLLKEYQLLPHVLPELLAMEEIPQDKEGEPDLFQHSLATLGRLAQKSCSPRERWAALLHDVGKLETVRWTNGILTFLGHEQAGARLAHNLLGRMKASNEEREEVVFLVRWHMLPIQYTPIWSDAAVKRFIRRMGQHLKPLLRLAQSDLQGAEHLEHHFWHLVKRVEALGEKQVQRISSPLSGEEIMDYFGQGPGPYVGKVKRELIDLLLEDRLDGSKESAFAYLQSRYPK